MLLFKAVKNKGNKHELNETNELQNILESVLTGTNFG